MISIQLLLPHLLPICTGCRKTITCKMNKLSWIYAGLIVRVDHATDAGHVRMLHIITVFSIWGDVVATLFDSCLAPFLYQTFLTGTIIVTSSLLGCKNGKN